MRNFSRRGKKIRTIATSVALIGSVFPVLTLASGANATQKPAAVVLPKAAIAPAGTMNNIKISLNGSIKLSVKSAFASPYAAGAAGAPYTGLIGSPVIGGSVISTYKWLINEDPSGDPTYDPSNCFPNGTIDEMNVQIQKTFPTAVVVAADPNGLVPGHLIAYGDFPAKCKNPSIHLVAGNAPVVTSGDQTMLSTSVQLNGLENGKNYLLSVTAPGFKIDGVHFTVNSAGAGVNAVNTPVLPVLMNPLPVKTTTLKIKVFNDNASTNGQWDQQAEDYVPAVLRPNGSVRIPEKNNMEGFTAHLGDVLAEVTTDVYGNPLCTEYETDLVTGNVRINGDGKPIPKVDASGGVSGGALAGSSSKCVSDREGDITIPNMGPNRYAVTIVPPNGQGIKLADGTRANAQNDKKWIETTTLEGWHDWDYWVQEGGTGFDTELVVGGERVPMVTFGFVQETGLLPVPGAGSVVGSVDGIISIGKTYTPTIGAGNYGLGFGAGLGGTKLAGTVKDGWVSLSCIAGCSPQAQDTAVYVGKADSNGHFHVDNVPVGTYVLTLWDETQDYILSSNQIDVKVNPNNPTVGMETMLGNLPLAGWFASVTGHVFVDKNGNGRQDPGEPGVPDFKVVVKSRGNSLYDQGAASSKTNDAGLYDLHEMYPLGQFLVVEAYNQRFKTTGITFQADNQPTETTLHTSQVDINALPIIGLAGRLDWGVQPYSAGDNGGIVGTVTYDTTRNETNTRQSVAEDYQPSVPGLEVQLWNSSKDLSGNYIKEASGAFAQFGFTTAGSACQRPSGLYGKQWDGTQSCRPINSYTTETWKRPVGCVPRDANGVPLGRDKQGSLVYPETNNPTADCIESPDHSIQFGGNGTVDGNFGFAGYYANQLDFVNREVDLANGIDNTIKLSLNDYLVEVVNPVDTVAKVNGRTQTKYKFTSESDINVFSGDIYAPQFGFAFDGSAAKPPAAPVVTTNVPLENPSTLSPSPDARCVGAEYVVDDSKNIDFLAAEGGSIYNGKVRNICDTKLVRVMDGRSVAPTFNVFTDVPIPTHFYGIVLDDLSISSDKRSTMYGETGGISNMPIGMYDEAGQLKHTVLSDYNGLYEMILPSTDTYNCPLPAGPCPNAYRLVANDPGQLGHANKEYNPAIRTIATEFQAWPGVLHPVDQAPTPITQTIFQPGSRQLVLAQCRLEDTTPQIYNVSQPYVGTSLFVGTGSTGRTITVKGIGFGTNGLGSHAVIIGGVAMPIMSWTDTEIVFTVPTAAAIGPQQLDIVNNGGFKTVNGLTFLVLGAGYSPKLYEVGPGHIGFDPNNDPIDVATGLPDLGPRAIQRALDAARTQAGPAQALVVVYPNTAPLYASFNPDAKYFENLIVDSAVKIQGTGPGGIDAVTKLPIPGTTVDGSSFWSGSAADGNYSTWWQDYVLSLQRNNAQPASDGEVIYVMAGRNNLYSGNPFKAGVDGMTITGADQQGFPNNRNVTGGAPNGQPVAPLATQGGGIFLDDLTDGFTITNNVIRSNGGTYGGGIRVGTPGLPGNNAFPFNGASSNNNRLKILKNRILANGGNNLAGGIGLFNGTNGYEIANNDLCGNYSTEYGGAISHYGYSTGTPRIHDNRIYFNQSYDEGGGIMIAGELPSNTTKLSQGAGSVEIDHNLIQDNLSNDDGGGIRFLMASGPGNVPFSVYDNIIANNVSTHEGGGIAIDDTPNVRFVNNTVVRNITTATAMTSNGLPAPAGLSTGANSSLLQARLPAGSSKCAVFMFNNIFADNRAGNWAGSGIHGIGNYTGEPINKWDMGTTDKGCALTPTNSVLDSTTASGASSGGSSWTASPTNTVITDIAQVDFVALYATTVNAAPLRTNPQFRQATIVALEVPVTLMGNYHLALHNGNRNSPDVVVDKGAVSKANLPGVPVTAPATDIDNQPRPSGSGFEIGADELAGGVAVIAPPSATPTILDDFNRNNNGVFTSANITDATHPWVGPIGFLKPLQSITGPVAARVLTGTFGSSSSVWSLGAGAAGAVNQEVGTTVTQLSTNPNTWVGLLLKSSAGSTVGADPTSGINVRYNASTGAIQVRTITAGAASVVLTIPAGSTAGFGAGSVLRARALADGTVIVYNGVTQIGQIATSFTAGGSIGLSFQMTFFSLNTARVDNFFGGAL